MSDPKLKLEQYFKWRRYVLSLRMPPCAVVLLDYYEINQGKNWLFHENKILYDLEYSHNTYLKARKALIDRQLILAHVVKESGRVVGSRVTVNYSIAADTNVDNSNVEKMNVEKANVDKSNVEKVNDLERKKIERKGEKGEKEVKAAVAAEGDRLSASAGAAASEAAPAAAAAADSPSPEISRSQDNKPRQSSKAAKASKAAAIPLSQNPPTRADVEASVARIAAQSHVAGWTPEAIKFKAFTIWNHYELRKWKRADGSDITDLDSCVFCWMKRDGFRPPVMNEPAPAPHPSPAPASNELSNLQPGQWAGAPIQKPQQKSFKQLEQEWIDRPLTDPEAWTVEDSAHLIFKARSDGEVQGILNSIPAHLHERALALAEQMRKEQGDKPRIIAPLPYEEETS